MMKLMLITADMVETTPLTMADWPIQRDDFR